MPRVAELDQRGAHARGLVLAGGDDDVGARRSRSASTATRVRCARDDDGQRDLAAPARRAGSPAAGAPVESKTTRRGWRCTPSIRAVSCGSSASAVPIPTTTASTAARQWCASSREDSPEIHFESPVRVRDLAVERHRRLEEDPRARPVRACLRNGLVGQAGAGGELAAGDVDLDPLVAQDARGRGRRPSRSGRRRRPRRGRCRPRRSRRCTAACLPCVAARLQRDIDASRRSGRRPRQAAIAAPSACSPPYSACQPSPRTAPSLHDHRADERVRDARGHDRSSRARWRARGAGGRCRGEARRTA